ncbi:MULTISPECIES: bifunctional phosphoribosyl-AMP cyclohydrolase/phosphoribosyl-ATP diphosphatase HisIE [Prochlorococcus]|uniref:bifunctional phosphoribosyl-AMP cyclohydrolase/phosphoribosyl-ATP diphosphatase HisIE n=1 Tax=Prochlorococcus TaxID=1218 RepID=UPI000533AD96|nr:MULTISPECIES: bifunctional phosphoribosyl-AMP cyclohydrolase/phosphoribosyl-ATP diphosphatase HisIE [Prochlorococcus]KGG12808.1 Phosphoribosyl-AMP cyclohydrolase [Prochlorococcus sp. MIT 0601]
MTQTSKDFINQLRFNENGLIPAIAQDWLDGAILMMAWMNKHSLEETIRTGEVHYWSRSRDKLWRKGETSGHIQNVKDIRYDCDADSLLLTIEQVGLISCHKGARSCFFQSEKTPSLDKEIFLPPPTDSCSEVFKIIKQRCLSPEEGSYTNILLEGGDNKILKKIGEESVEFVMACKDNNKNDIANEAADLIYHLQVALASHDVNWRDVLEVLALRRATK